jgi:hypothetical protein
LTTYHYRGQIKEYDSEGIQEAWKNEKYMKSCGRKPKGKTRYKKEAQWKDNIVVTLR